MKKKILSSMAVVVLSAAMLAGCTEASQVSHNVSQEADNFNVLRRFAVINTRTDNVEFELIGAFSLQVENSHDNQVEVVVELEDGTYKKHIIGAVILFLPSLVSTIYLQMDKVMIEWLTGETAQISYYDQAEKIVMIPLTFITVLSTVMMPRIANELPMVVPLS